MTVEQVQGDRGLSAFRGLRVVELGTWLAAPSACALLADLGAEVIKVEPSGGDPLRKFPSSMRGGSDKSPGFALLNRHKKSVVIDITSAEGIRQIESLLAGADVFVTNLRSGTLEKLKLDADALTRRFPRLVYGIVTGQGLSGPDKDMPGMDTGVFWARSGMLHQLTAEGAEPLVYIGGYGDLVTSLALFGAVLAALVEREKTGRGRVVETSLLQSGGWMLSGDVVAQAAFGRAPKLRTRSQSATPLVNSYRTADGRWFFLTSVEAGRHFQGVCRAIDQPQLAQDERFATPEAMRKNGRELIALLEGAFARHPLAHWTERLNREGVWWQKVATPAEMMEDVQVTANAMAGAIAWGGSSIQAITAPFKVHGNVMKTPAKAPELGEHGELTGGEASVPPVPSGR